LLVRSLLVCLLLIAPLSFPAFRDGGKRLSGGIVKFVEWVLIIAAIASLWPAYVLGLQDAAWIWLARCALAVMIGLLLFNIRRFAAYYRNPPDERPGSK